MRQLIGLFAVLMFTAGAGRADPIADVRLALSYEISSAKTSGAVIVVDVTEAGHWHLANRDDERFIAANGVELRRGLTSLGRAAASDGTVGHVYVTPRAAFRHWKALREVRAASLDLVDRGRFPLNLRPDAPPLVRSAVGPADIRDVAALHALNWHLGRPLGTVRILALEAGGPNMLTRRINREPESGDSLIDAVDPSALVDALPALWGQVAVVTGRVDGNMLRVRGSRGGEQTVDLIALRRAAETSGVSIVLRHGASPAQPYTPRFRLLRRDPSGPPQTLADFVRANVPAAVAEVRTRDNDWIDVLIEPETTGVLDPARWTRAVTDLVKPIFGETPTERLSLWLPPPKRQQELGWRVFGWLPSWAMLGYSVLLALGLVGLPTARRWFARIWPPEPLTEYGNRWGWHAARAVRSAIFTVVFVPLAAIVTAPAQLVRLMRRTP